MRCIGSVNKSSKSNIAQSFLSAIKSENSSGFRWKCCIIVNVCSCLNTVCYFQVWKDQNVIELVNFSCTFGCWWNNLFNWIDPSLPRLWSCMLFFLQKKNRFIWIFNFFVLILHFKSLLVNFWSIRPNIRLRIILYIEK